MVIDNLLFELDALERQRLIPTLLKLGKVDMVHRIFSEETKTQRHAWYEVRESCGEVDDYVGDLVRVQKWAQGALASVSHSEQEWAEGIGRQYQIALMLATLNDLAGSLTLELLVALVENGVWMPTQGLAYVRRIADKEERGVALIALAPTLRDSPELMEEVLALAAQATKPKTLATALAGLAPFLSPHLLDRALQLALGMEYGSIGWLVYQVDALLGLIPNLTTAQLEHLVSEDVQFSLGEQTRSPVLLAAAQRLLFEKPWAAHDLLQRIAYPRDDPWLRAQSEVLASMAQQGRAQEALEYASFRSYGDPQIHLLARLIPHLPEPLQSRAHGSMMAMVANIPLPADADQSTVGMQRISLMDMSRETRIELLPYLPDELRHHALGLTLYEWFPEDGPELIVRAADRAPATDRPLIYEGALGLLASSDDGPFQNLVQRERMFAKLLPAIPDENLLQALASASTLLAERCYHAGVLIGELPLEVRDADLSLGMTGEEFMQALSTYLHIDQLQDNLDTIVALARRDPTTCASLAIRMILSLEDYLVRLYALSELADQLPVSLLHETIELGQALHASRTQRPISAKEQALTCVALATVAQQLPGNERAAVTQYCIDAANQIGLAQIKAQTLVELAELVAEPQKSELLRQGLIAARQIDDRLDLAQMSGSLAVHLPKGGLSTQLVQTIDLINEVFPQRPAQSMADHLTMQARASVLNPLIPLIAENGYLAQARSYIAAQDVSERIVPLVSILHCLPATEQGTTFEQTWQWAQAHDRVYEWAQALVANAQALRPSRQEQLVAAVDDLEEDDQKARLYAGLKCCLAEPLRDQISRAAYKLVMAAHEELSLEGLLAALSCLDEAVPEHLERDLWQLFETEVEETLLWDLKGKTLVFRAPPLIQAVIGLEGKLAAPLPSKLLALAKNIQHRANQVGMLAALTPYLSAAQGEEIALEVLEALDESLSPYTEEFQYAAQVQLAAATTPFVPDFRQFDAKERLYRALALWRRERDQTQRIQRLSEHSLTPLTVLPAESLHEVWSHVLRDATSLHRRDLWNDTTFLLPLGVALGGNQTVTEILKSTLTVANWWP